MDSVERFESDRIIHVDTDYNLAVIRLEGWADDVHRASAEVTAMLSSVNVEGEPVNMAAEVYKVLVHREIQSDINKALNDFSRYGKPWLLYYNNYVIIYVHI